MTIRQTQRFLLAASEGASYGVGAALTGANAILINDDFEVTPIGGQVISRTIVRPFMGGQAGLLIPGEVMMTFSVELSGSGAGATAPGIAPVLRSCRTNQIINAAAVTGTAAAGGVGTITLAVGASAVDDFYLGQIITTTGGTGAGESGRIDGYVGSTRVATVERITATYAPNATSQYSIAPSVSFRPISTINGVADTSCTLAFNIGGIEHRIVGCRGNVEITDFVIGSIPKLRFTMTGIYVPVSDVTIASYGAVSYVAQADPFDVSDETTKAFSFFGNRLCLQSLDFNLNNQVDFNERINCGQRVEINDSEPSGMAVVDAVLMAAFNPFALALNDSSLGRFAVTHGTTAGRRVSLVAPRIDLLQPSYSAPQNGRAMWILPFTAVATPPGGNEFALVYS